MPELTRNSRRTAPSNGGRGVLPPLSHGGGGGGGGGRGDDHQPDYAWKLRRYRLGLAFGIASITLLFITLTACFLLLRSSHQYEGPGAHFVPSWLPIPIPSALLLVNTGILLFSSLTLERARHLARMESILVPATRIPGVVPVAQSAVRWVYATTFLGFAFLLGQWRAWEWLQARDIVRTSGPASSLVYFITGAHALHLLGGILVLLYACFGRGPRHSLERRRIAVDVTTFYWHFMFVLWIYILALLWYFGAPTPL
jgi:cytochrome c oxidase subunit III